MFYCFIYARVSSEGRSLLLLRLNLFNFVRSSMYAKVSIYCAINEYLLIDGALASTSNHSKQILIGNFKTQSHVLCKSHFCSQNVKCLKFWRKFCKVVLKIKCLSLFWTFSPDRKLNSLSYRQCHQCYESFQLKIILSKTSTGFRCPSTSKAANSEGVGVVNESV